MKCFVTGIGTEVGKTVISAIIVKCLNAEYWKPVQAGELHNTDSDKVRELTGAKIYPEAFRLKTPASPHYAAKVDRINISLNDFTLPEAKSLIVEGAGGLMVPLNEHDMIIDLIEQLKLPVILVSKQYLGSINHTLLSIEALRKRDIPIAGIVFNGERKKSSEEAITNIGNVEVLGFVEEEKVINSEIINRYADQLREKVLKALVK